MIVLPKDDNIWLYGPKMARIESEFVDIPDYTELVELREYMVGVMRRSNGIGLSAPQVGVFKNFFVMERGDGSIVDMVNPDITRMYGKELSGIEACLSVPPVGNGFPMPRMQKVTVEYSSAEDPKDYRVVEFQGRDAVVIQHELDHLTGTFFFDRIPYAHKQKVLDSFEKWKRENEHNAKDNTRPLAAYCV